MSNYGDNVEQGKVYKVEDVISESYLESVKAIKITSLGVASYSAYESGVMSPGAATDGYDVKNIGGRFSTVETAYRVIIKNNDDILPITLYLNSDNINPITLGADSELDITGLAVTNIFIDTMATYSSAVEVTLFG